MPTRYRSSQEDSARWDGFAFRPGDIVISTRSKSGTTWMQRIAALLVFREARLPEPLGRLSPWLDWLGEPVGDLHARLAAQPHRRFIKTHSPLDGIPLDPRACYIVVARHPLDSALSLYHQGRNIDRERLRTVTGRDSESVEQRQSLTARQWLAAWIESGATPAEDLDSLRGVLWHLCDAWARRGEPNVLLVHYEDLQADLEGEMRRIAAWLGSAVAEDRWPALVQAAGFAAMRERARELAPDPGGIFKDKGAFFRSGRSGEGRAAVGAEDLAHYEARCAALAPPDLLAWLHR